MKIRKRTFVKWALIILGIIFGMIIGPDGGSVGVTQSEVAQPNPMGRQVFLVQGQLQAVPLPRDLRLQDSLRSRVLGTSLATTEGDMLWNRPYEGTGSAIPGPLGAFPLIQTADGGFILAGRMGGDAWLAKTDFHGDIEWQQTYGGAGEEAAQVVIQTADGGFALAGYTDSYGSGRQDFWLIKTDVHGDMEWNRTYDQGGYNDFVYAGIQTADGGFVLAGRTAFYDEGGFDAWLVKTDVYGNIEWQQTYGGDSGEGARAMIQTVDGGFAFAGRTFSFGAGKDDFWLVKTDAHGKIEWQQTYGSADREGSSAVIQTVDGGFVLAGYTADPGASDPTSWLDNIWLVKTDARGTVQWTRTYGGSGDDEAYAVIQMADGGFILAGRMGGDAWLAKTDFRGDIEWQQTYGGAGEEAAQAVIQTADGGFALAGYKDGSAWLVKTIPPDTDGDGLPDGYEVEHGLDPLSEADSGEDPDQDGLATLDEYRQGTKPRVADSDGDGLVDGEEVVVYKTDPLIADSDGDGLVDGEEVVVYKTDPLVADSDRDGLPDGEEVIAYHTDPTVADAEADTDRDSLFNVEEVTMYNTNPLVVDTDGDKLPDGYEVEHGLDPLSEADSGEDPDQDGLATLDEYRQGTKPKIADSDGDGLRDGDEVAVYNTDPLVADSDGDSYSDGDEVVAGFDPNDPAEYPSLPLSTTPPLPLATGTIEPSTFFIPGFNLLEGVLALACLVVLARRTSNGRSIDGGEKWVR